MLHVYCRSYRFWRFERLRSCWYATRFNFNAVKEGLTTLRLQLYKNVSVSFALSLRIPRSLSNNLALHFGITFHYW